MARFTRQERIEYHLNMAKVGACNKNGEPLSDFARGKHAQAAETLIAQKNRWLDNNLDKLTPENRQKHIDSKTRRQVERTKYLAERNKGGK